jgi:hypothetical protein
LYMCSLSVFPFLCPSVFNLSSLSSLSLALSSHSRYIHTCTYTHIFVLFSTVSSACQ